MAVTKRVRFEILRRDNHACQYCGLVAPDTELTIDHVIPVALGGSDKPDNLVAACKDCNAGKTSISPDSPIVESVAARNAEFAVAQANIMAHVQADYEATREYCDNFETAWNIWGRGEGKTRTTMPLPPDWRRSLVAWWKMGLPEELLRESIATAMVSKGRNHAGIVDSERWRYFCGVIWRTLEEYEATYPLSSNAGRVYSATEYKDHGLEEWSDGWDHGDANGFFTAVQMMQENPEQIQEEAHRRMKTIRGNMEENV